MISVTGRTAARAIIAASLATCAGASIVRGLRAMPPTHRRIMWILLVAVVVAPDLITGYAYSNFALSLARWPVANEISLTLLIAAKSTAVAAIIALFTPAPALPPGGRHLLRLARNRLGWRDRFAILWRGHIDRWLPVWAIAFLYAFQQFELPSLTNSPAWTVALFDRQALLPDLSDSADPAIWPLLVELMIVIPLLVSLSRAVQSTRRSVVSMTTPRSWLAISCGVLAAVFTLSVVIPWTILLWEASQGLSYFQQAGPALVSYFQQIGTALLFGSLSGVLAWLGAFGLLRLVSLPRGRFLGWPLLVLVSLPGLCGPLIPSLFAVEFLQTPMGLPWRETIVPTVVVLALMLFPRAILLEVLARLDQKQSALHLAQLLKKSPSPRQSALGREQLWRLVGFGRYCRISLLIYWGYLDLTVSKMLAPTDMESVTLWLYNFMHYGRNSSLSAMAFVATIAPLGIFLALLIFRHLAVKLGAR